MAISLDFAHVPVRFKYQILLSISDINNKDEKVAQLNGTIQLIHPLIANDFMTKI